MKKIILLALAAMIMVGCNQVPSSIVDGWTVLTIDSCEYMEGYYRLAHKGNCRFCKERKQKELKELVEQLKTK